MFGPSLFPSIDSASCGIPHTSISGANSASAFVRLIDIAQHRLLRRALSVVCSSRRGCGQLPRKFSRERGTIISGKSLQRWLPEKFSTWRPGMRSFVSSICRAPCVVSPFQDDSKTLVDVRS